MGMLDGPSDLTPAEAANAWAEAEAEAKAKGINITGAPWDRGRPKVHLRARLDSAEATQRAMDSGSGETSSIEDQILTKGLQRAVSVGRSQ